MCSYPRSSWGCNQDLFLIWTGQLAGPFETFLSLQSRFYSSRDSLSELCQCSRLLQIAAFSHFASFCKEAESSSRRASQLQAVPHAAEVAWWFIIILVIIDCKKKGHLYNLVLGVSKWEIRVGQNSFSLSVCSSKGELPDATLQGAQIKQKSLRATSSSLWPEGALTLNILTNWT